MLQDLEFENFIKTPIGTVKVYKTPPMTELRLPGEDWEHYMARITAWQAKRGYPRFGKAKTRDETLKEKWQQELNKKEPEYPSNSQFIQVTLTQVKGRRYFKKHKYTILLELYQRQYKQHSNDNWESFDYWVNKNYILDTLLMI